MNPHEEETHTAPPAPRGRGIARTLLGWLLALAMVSAGVAHFTSTQDYVEIMPGWLGWHTELVLLSGGFEILGGLGLLLRRTRRAAAWGLVALFLCVFPANVQMALDGVQWTPFFLWARLPLQLVFIAWAVWLAREPPS